MTIDEQISFLTKGCVDVIPAEELKKWEGNPRGFLAWLREHTLGLGK